MRVTHKYGYELKGEKGFPTQLGMVEAMSMGMALRKIMVQESLTGRSMLRLRVQAQGESDGGSR